MATKNKNSRTNKVTQYEPKLCNVIVDNTEDYHNVSIPCNQKVKYKVKYRKATTGKFVEKYVCGLHFRQLEKMSTSLKKTTGYNNEFSYTKIN